MNGADDQPEPPALELFIPDAGELLQEIDIGVESFELGRVVVPLERAVALEPQLAAHPLDGAAVAHEPDAVLPTARGPREEHRHQPLGVLEVQ